MIDFSNYREKVIKTVDPRRNIVLMSRRRERKLTAAILGTGMPVPDIMRSGAATAILYKRNCILVDCARWVSRQIILAKIPFSQIDGLLITHLHQDHINGWPTLWMDSIFSGRANPWKIWGPKGTKEVINAIRIFNRLDLENRIVYNMNLEGLKTEVQEIDDGFRLEVGGIKITAAFVKHVPNMECFAFRFDTPEKSILISGDTTKNENLINLGKKSPVDVLIHEIILDDVVRFAVKNRFLRGTEETAERIINCHSTISQVIEVANEIRPKKLVLTHIMPTIASPDYIENKIRENFEGEVICANDLDEF